MRPSRPTRPTADVLRIAGLLRAAEFTVAETAALCGLDPADVPDPADELVAAFGPPTERYSDADLERLAREYYRDHGGPGADPGE